LNFALPKIPISHKIAILLMQLCGSIAAILGIVLAVTNFIVVSEGNVWIVEKLPHKKMSFAVVLGAGVHGLELSGALKARMEIAVTLLRENLADSILLSGDGTDAYYNETKAMQIFALQQGVKPSQIYLDPRGYSTYDSIVQAKSIYNIENAYFVSQRFHLPRLLWLADSLGIEAAGIPTDPIENEAFYALREIPARTKDYLLHFLDYVPHGRRQPAFR
jgi:SanA protein